jgi:hypothetical protein
MIEQATGLVRPSIGQMLSPIQNLCLRKKPSLPPLTILVVRDESGIPGDGFIAAKDIPRAQQEVFAFDWLKFGCPQTEEFEEFDTNAPDNVYAGRRADACECPGYWEIY